MTLLEEARRGTTTPIMCSVAEAEKAELNSLRNRIAAGRVVIPCNRKRESLGLPVPTTCGIGEGLRTKVNANIGTSEDYADTANELEKLAVAVGAGADTVMDLSTGGDIRAIRRRILETSTVPVGTVPIYDAAVRAVHEHGAVSAMTAEHILGAVRDHAEQGVDFVTVHCGVTRQVIRTLESTPRVCGIVSRGGSFLANWMARSGRENPLYEQFDELLAILHDCDVMLSLGDGLRPGALADAFDRSQVHELNVLAGLATRAREAGVQVIIEGPGHVPLNQIEAQVRMQKELCSGAPFYVLGPLVTDVAPGYDHITAAIGGAVAAAAGVDFLCYVTPTEHLGLPAAAHVREGVIASRIAAHAGDLAKGVPGAAEWDRTISALRQKRDWKALLDASLDPVRAKALREGRCPGDVAVCSMCGEFCVFKIAQDTARSSRADSTPAGGPNRPA